MPHLRPVRIALFLASLLAAPAAADEHVPKPCWLPDAPSPNADALPPGAFARLGSTWLKHGNSIDGLAVSADGRVIASASPERIILWDAATGRERHRYRSAQPFGPPGKSGRWIAAGGNTLVAANGSPEMRFIDMTTGRYTRVTAPPDAAFSEVAISPDGAVAAAVQNHPVKGAGQKGEEEVCRVTLWDAARGRKLRDLAIDGGRSLQVALSPDGKRLAELRTDHRLHLWDVPSGRELRAYPTGLEGSGKLRLAFSPAELTLAVNDEGGEAVILEAETGKQLGRLDAELRGESAAAFSPDGKVLALGGIGATSLLDVASGREARRLDFRGNSTEAVAFGRDGKTLVTGGRDGQVQVWDLPSGRERLAAVGHAYPPGALVFSPDGRLLASGVLHGAVCLWDVTAGREARRLPKQPFGISLAFSPDGARLATATYRDVALWDPATGRRVAASGSAEAEYSCVGFARDGRSLVCFDGEDMVWRSADSLAVEKRFRDRAKDARHAATAAGGGKFLLATNGERREIVVWDGAGEQVIRLDDPTPYTVTSVALSPDGRHLAYCLNSQCVLFDLVNRVALHRWYVLQLGVLDASLAFSADGRLLAAHDDPEGALLFEIASRGEVARLKGDAGSRASLSFSPDGRTLATTEPGGAILLWDLTGTRKGARGAAATAAELAAMWDDLGGEDAARAYRAVWRLAEAPAQAVPFLRGRLKPAEAIPAERVRALVADLNDRSFATRQAAFRGLNDAAEVIEPDLRRAASGHHSAEVGEELGKILKTLEAGRSRPTGERLRSLRAVQALEYMRTPESRELLKHLAGGAPGATLTREARAALDRPVR